MQTYVHTYLQIHNHKSDCVRTIQILSIHIDMYACMSVNPKIEKAK